MQDNFDSRAYYNGNIKPFKLGVFGSRTLKGDVVRAIIYEFIKEKNATKIITSQEPMGVCEVAQKVAKDLAIPLELHFINIRYLKGAFDQRSIEVIKEADFMLFIHDGYSKGTTNEINVTKKLKKPYHIEIIEDEGLVRNVGFNIKNEWTDNNDELKLEW